jgi:hypothetical protein
MLFYPSEVPALFSLVWSSDGFSSALAIGALIIASVLGLVALRDRRRHSLRVAPLQRVPHSACLDSPRAAA